MTLETVLAGIVITLAVFRLTRLVIRDEITEPLREKIWKKYPPHTKLGYLITCPWCVSPYIATLFVVSYILLPTFTLIVASIFAVSALVGLIDERTS